MVCVDTQAMKVRPATRTIKQRATIVVQILSVFQSIIAPRTHCFLDSRQTNPMVHRRMIEIVFSILDGRLTFLLTERHHSIINKLRRNDPKNWAMPKRHVGIRLLRLSMAALLRVGLLALLIQAGWPQPPKPKLEPRIFSIYPLGDQPGVTYEATIRGFMLRDAQAIWFETDGIRARR